MLRCGLLGEKLGHSYSAQIHAMLGGYEYKMYEKSHEEVMEFLKGGDWDALNVTIPYKNLAASVCDALSETSASLGSANTLVRRDGKLYGYNTDYFGFSSMLAKSKVDVKGKKALVLGSGGAGVTVCAVLKSLGAVPVTISRSGENNYSNLYLHGDAGIIVNATPVGMYPKNGISPIDLRDFPDCAGVFDLIYNPLRTSLMLQAEELGIPHMSGLHMLVAQAKKSSELFLGTTIPDDVTDRIENTLSESLGNISLIGMPGCGKTTVAQLLANRLGRELIDTDAEIEKCAGMSIPQIFSEKSEGEFRRLESLAIGEAGKKSGKIISTGGGCVTLPENYPLLHQNGVIVWIKRDTCVLPTDGRPISQSSDMSELYKRREPMYRRFCDFEVDNDGTPEDTADKIIRLISEDGRGE